MQKRSRTEITIETDRTFVITKRVRQLQNWCSDCTQPSRMVSPEDAVHLTGLTSRAVYRALETGKVHFMETRAGLVLFCLNSLSLVKGPANTKSSGLRIVPSRSQAIRTEIEQRFEGPHANLLDVAATSGNNWGDNGLQDHPKRTAWVLTPEAFDKLLDRLDETREHAGETYEKIRRRLIKYFEFRGCASPEEHADETIDRVARKISEGKQIWTSDPASYFYGVARNVMREYWDSMERGTLPIDSVLPLTEPCEPLVTFHTTEAEWSLELGLQALEHSMAALPAESRALILEYYRGEKGEKIRNRQNIAKRLGIPSNALRIRVHRIREKLERDVLEYLRATGETKFAFESLALERSSKEDSLESRRKGKAGNNWWKKKTTSER